MGISNSTKRLLKRTISKKDNIPIKAKNLDFRHFKVTDQGRSQGVEVYPPPPHHHHVVFSVFATCHTDHYVFVVFILRCLTSSTKKSWLHQSRTPFLTHLYISPPHVTEWTTIGGQYDVQSGKLEKVKDPEGDQEEDGETNSNSGKGQCGPGEQRTGNSGDV